MDQERIPPFAGMLSDPSSAGAICSYIRRTTDPVDVFRWFKRLLFIPGAYVHRDIIAIDGDVIRKALRSSAAVDARELAVMANGGSRHYRSIPAFVAAALLVNNRIDDKTRNLTPIKYGKSRDNFERAISYISKNAAPGTVYQAQILAGAKQYVAMLLRQAGYPDHGVEIGNQITKLSIRVRERVYKNEFRGFTDRWTFSIGHVVVLAYLIKAKDVGLADYKGVEIWSGLVANRYLMKLVSEISPNVEFVKPRSAYADNHAVGHWEWIDGAYANYFDACGLVADRAGDEHGAILPKPARSEPAIQAFFEATGLGDGDRIVTLHCRGTGFRVDRRHDLRNVDIETYLPALRLLADRGYKIVRLGDKSMKALPPMPGVIDYARSKLKSPELDVLLPAIADFHIGSSSGLSLVPLLYGTPTLYLNWYPLDMMPWGRLNWTVLKPIRPLGQPDPINDASLYFKVGRMPDRSLLNAWGYDLGELSEAQVTQAVVAFTERLGTRRAPPAKAGRNIGRILMAAADGAREPFLETPTELVPGPSRPPR